MKTNKISKLIIGSILIGLFALWTILVKVVDVQPVGPSGSEIGFASLNTSFDNLIAYNETLYKITDVLGYVVILAAAVFGVIGVIQWIKRKSLLKVDHQILLLGASYIIVIGVYVLFEIVIINYRPILTDPLEASYPSSHTMTALYVFLSAIPVVNYLLKYKNKLKTVINISLIVLAAFTVIGRVLSGAHWLSDIIGGVLFSIGLLYIYLFFIEFVDSKKHNEIPE